MPVSAAPLGRNRPCVKPPFEKALQQKPFGRAEHGAGNAGQQLDALLHQLAQPLRVKSFFGLCISRNATGFK